MKLLMLIVIFFLIGAFFIISQENLHISDSTELNKFNTAYVSWLEDLSENFKQVTGYVVKMDWLPE